MLCRLIKLIINKMEINQAKITLQEAISSPNTSQGLVPALQLAFDLLNNTFEAQFVSLETAQKEANDLAAEKNKTINEKNVAIADKDAIVLNLATETKRADDAEALVEEKVSDIVALSDELVAKQEEVDAKVAIIEDVTTTITTILENPEADIEAVKEQLSTKIEEIKPVEPTPVVEEIVTP